MRLELTLRAAVKFVKASVFLVCSWPPSPRVGKLRLIIFRVRWWISCILLVVLFLPLLNGVWHFRRDTVVAVKAILMTTATAQAIIKICVCRHQRDHLQVLHEEMENFLDKAKAWEINVLQRYLKRCGKFYSFVTVCVYSACLGFIVEPLLLSQPFPTDSAFPFTVQFHPVYEIIYVQQAVAIVHIAAALSIDNQVAILFWYTAARFEMLGDEIENSRSRNDLVRCIAKHQKLLIYANNLTRAIRMVALTTIVTTTVGIICGGLTLISGQPISVKLRVGNMVFNASVELFVYAWPADKLIETSQAIGSRVYNCAWLGKPRSMQKILLSVIQRSQEPVTISVGGLFPALSLHYYASFLSSAFSYFSTLRIMYNDEG